MKIEINERNEGIQIILKTKKKKRVSCIQSPYSYGGKQGLWEILIEGTLDPIGHLTWKQVLEHLNEN